MTEHARLTTAVWLLLSVGLGILRLARRAAWGAPAWLTRVLPDIRFSHK